MPRKAVRLVNAMLRLLKRYFWVVDVAAIALCATLAASAANHYIAGRFLATTPAAATPPDTPRQQAPPAAPRSKSGAALAARNMFCHECTEPSPEPPVEQPAVASDRPPETDLPLRLLATHVSAPQTASVATVANTSSSVTGAYRVTNRIPQAGEVLRITGKYIDFTNAAAGRVERLSLAPEPRAGAAKAKPKAGPARRPKRQAPSELDEQIRRVADDQFEIDRELVNQLLANPTRLRGMRVTPYIKDGKAAGIRLFAVRPSSVAARLGLQNGDTLHTINGFSLASPDEAFETYTKVRSATSLEVQVTRRGKPTTLRYAIK